MGKSIAGIVGVQHANWQQLNPRAALGQVTADSNRLRQYRDVKSIVALLSFQIDQLVIRQVLVV